MIEEAGGVAVELHRFVGGGEETLEGFLTATEPGGAVFLTLPDGGGPTAELGLGEYIDVTVQRGDGLYVFIAQVTDKGAYGGNPAVKARVRSEIRKVRRRGFHRYAYGLPMRYKVAVGGRGPTEGGREREALTRDVSGGGFSFDSDEEYAVPSAIHGTMEVRSHRISFVGTVVRAEPRAGSGGGGHGYAVRFDVIGDKDREALIKHIFLGQRLAK
ncbi:MAG: PilZ domain-containing protein [Oscillospiraceae bacterium]|nr:PilZ domain-containing protein [Oscillospiraceae bacterium]